MYVFIIIKYLKIKQKEITLSNSNCDNYIVVVMYVGVDTLCMCVVVGFTRDCEFLARRIMAAVAKSSFGSVQTVKQAADLVSYFDG